MNDKGSETTAIEMLPRKPEFMRRRYTVTARRVKKEGLVETETGETWARPGDWIVTGSNGERYRMPDAQFRAAYEPTNKKAKELWGEALNGQVLGC